MAALGANEASKESHVTGGAMMDLSGNPVTVESPESFANLWDLPTFSSRTLAEMRHITLALSTGAEVTLDIASAMKTPGTASATFRSTDGSSIIIDAVSRVALVNWNDESYVVSSVSGRRNLAEARGGQLYHAGDFFSLENGFHVDLEGNHRRLADSDNQGYAAFALSAGKEMMDMASEEDAVAYESVYFKASLRTSAGNVPTEVFYTSKFDRENGVGSKVRIGDLDGGSYLTDLGLGFGFRFDAGGALLSCDPLEDLSDAEPELEQMAVETTDDGLQLVLSDDGNLLIVDKTTLVKDPTGDAIYTPSVEECAAITKAAYVAGDDIFNPSLSPKNLSDWVHADGRRLWGGEVGHKELWMVSKGGYKTNEAPDGWATWKACEGENAYAKFIYKYPETMTVSFAGTDGLSDFGDWKDNLNTDVFCSAGVCTHEGFNDYMMKINDCVNDGVSQLKGWGIQIDYIVGHSLGGAAATVYSQKNNNPATHGVATFGAPKTRAGNDGSCSVPGVRYAHEKDAVASNAMGVMKNFNHDVQESTQVYNTRTCSEKFWGICYKWSSQKITRNQGCSEPSGGCSWLADCAYYFATVHGLYGDYL
jgi:hypothetical protein